MRVSHEIISYKQQRDLYEWIRMKCKNLNNSIRVDWNKDQLKKKKKRKWNNNNRLFWVLGSRSLSSHTSRCGKKQTIIANNSTYISHVSVLKYHDFCPKQKEQICFSFYFANDNTLRTRGIIIHVQYNYLFCSTKGFCSIQKTIM